jgi:hypothetical protein
MSCAINVLSTFKCHSPNRISFLLDEVGHRVCGDVTGIIERQYLITNTDVYDKGISDSVGCQQLYFGGP